MVGGGAVAVPARGPTVAPDGTVAERVERRIGFRRVEVRGVELLVNGRAVLIRGVNRHDFDPRTGRVVSPEDMRADVVAMKRWGFNAVRIVALPERPGFPRRLRRARAVRHRRGGHRVARLVRGRVPGPPLPVRVRRPRGADDRARPPPPVDHRLVAGQRVRLRAEPRRGRRLGARRRPVATPALRGRDQVRLVIGGDRERHPVPDVPADRLAWWPTRARGRSATRW